LYACNAWSLLESESERKVDVEKSQIYDSPWGMGSGLQRSPLSGGVLMVVMGRCDCCGIIRVLHGAGDYVICDECELIMTPKHEEE
jgi:hypothetical protein